MSFEKLVAVVAPPEAPVGHRNGGQWEAVERTLGTPLPEDYKRLVNAYGVGWFANWICVFSPFSEEFSLITMKEQILGMYRQGQREAPEYAPPYPAFPEPGGLLPLGPGRQCGRVLLANVRQSGRLAHRPSRQ